MKAITYGISVLIIVSGALFALQGLSLLPSRVMFGRQEWVVIGGVMVISGLALAAFVTLRARRSAHPTDQPTNRLRDQPTK
jgi:hypothetical protein